MVFFFKSFLEKAKLASLTKVISNRRTLTPIEQAHSGREGGVSRLLQRCTAQCVVHVSAREKSCWCVPHTSRFASLRFYVRLPCVLCFFLCSYNGVRQDVPFWQRDLYERDRERESYHLPQSRTQYLDFLLVRLYEVNADTRLESLPPSFLFLHHQLAFNIGFLW